MKNCPNCNARMEDGAVFCTNCGARFTDNAQQTAPNGNAAPNYGAQPQYAPIYNPYDHTAEFDKKDISDNKVICMLVYLTSWVGIIIALLTQSSSPYVAFHVRQALKIVVVEALIGLSAAVLVWTFIVPIAAVVMLLVFFVIKIICFFQVCSGKAVEPAIIRSLNFLK